MNDNEFPHEFNLRFRNHAFFVHMRSTLEFANEIAKEGPSNLSRDDLALFDDLAEQLEQAWIEAVKVKKSARGDV